MAEAEILQAFELCDKDGDGIISIEDMSQVLREFGRETKLADVATCLAKLDHNGDGKVDLQDFTTSIKAGISWMPTSGPPSQSSPRSPKSRKKKPTTAVKVPTANTSRPRAQTMSGEAFGQMEALIAACEVKVEEAQLAQDGVEAAGLSRLLEGCCEAAGKLCTHGRPLLSKLQQQHQDRNRQTAGSLQATAELEAALAQSQQANTSWQAKWAGALENIESADEAREQMDSLLEAQEALRVSLKTAIEATIAAENRAKRAEHQFETAQTDLLQAELDSSKLQQELGGGKKRESSLSLQLEESQAEVEEVDQRLRQMTVQLEQASDARKSYEQQLSDAHQLMVSQRQLCDSLRDTMEASTHQEDLGGLGGLAAEMQVGEVESLAHEVSALNASVKQNEDRHADVLAEVKTQLGVQMAQMQAQLQNNGMEELKQMLSDSQTARTQEAAAAGESAELEKLEEELSSLKAQLSSNGDCSVKLQATEEKLVAADAMLSMARLENAQTREEAKQSEVSLAMAKEQLRQAEMAAAEAQSASVTAQEEVERLKQRAAAEQNETQHTLQLEAEIAELQEQLGAARSAGAKEVLEAQQAAEAALEKSKLEAEAAMLREQASHREAAMVQQSQQFSQQAQLAELEQQAAVSEAVLESVKQQLTQAREDVKQTEVALGIAKEQLKQAEGQASVTEVPSTVSNTQNPQAQEFHYLESSRLQNLLAEAKVEKAESLVASNREWAKKRDALYARHKVTEMVSKSLLKHVVGLTVQLERANVTVHQVVQVESVSDHTRFGDDDLCISTDTIDWQLQGDTLGARKKAPEMTKLEFSSSPL